MYLTDNKSGNKRARTEQDAQKSAAKYFAAACSDYFTGLKLSFSDTLRLNTSAPGAESLLSTQK